MELEQLKRRISANLGKRHCEPRVTASITAEIAALNARIVRRKIYGTITLAISAAFFVAMAWVAYRMNASIIAITGILVCVGTFVVAVAALHRMQYRSSPAGQTVLEAQQAQLLQVRREIVFYRRFSPWFFVGATFGAGLLCAGVLGDANDIPWSSRLLSLFIPVTIMAVSIGFALKANRDHIRSQLDPLESRLRENVDAMIAESPTASGLA